MPPPQRHSTVAVGEVAAMWRFSKNNGVTEAFYGKTRLIQRRAYGFRNLENYRPEPQKSEHATEDPESAPPWNRTKNLVIKSHALCQLS